MSSASNASNFPDLDTGMRYKQNMAMSGLYRLPNEVLIHIIRATTIWALGEDESPKIELFSPDEPPRWKGPAPFWTRTMIIGRRMREVVLENQRLWSVVCTDHKCREWVDLCLKRAGTYPLELRGTVQDASQDATSSILNLLPRANRIRLLLDCLPDGTGSPYILQRLFDAMALQWNSNSTSARPQLFMVRSLRTDWYGVRKDFLGGSTSTTHLTSLHLDRARIHDLPNMPRLQHLSLSETVLEAECQNLWNLLQRLPTLVSLSLVQPIVDFTDDDGDDAICLATIIGRNPPTLPCLSQVEISGGLRGAAMVAHTVPDPSTRLILDGILVEDHLASVAIEEYSRVLQLRGTEYMRRAHAHDALCSHVLVVDSISFLMTHLTVNALDPDLDVHDYPPSRHLKMSLLSFGPLDKIASSDLTSCLNGLVVPGVDIMKVFAPKCPNLTHLTIRTIPMDPCERLGNQRALEGILSSIQNPLHTLKLGLRITCEQGISHHEKDFKNVLEEKWKRSSWTQHVEWLVDEEPSSQRTFGFGMDPSLSIGPDDFGDFMD